MFMSAEALINPPLTKQWGSTNGNENISTPSPWQPPSRHWQLQLHVMTSPDIISLYCPGDRESSWTSSGHEQIAIPYLKGEEQRGRGRMGVEAAANTLHQTSYWARWGS